MEPAGTPARVVVRKVVKQEDWGHWLGVEAPSERPLWLELREWVAVEVCLT